MTEKTSVELLTPSHNYAVVHLPGRRFPGVVFQGDSLNSLIGTLRTSRSALASAKVPEALETLDSVIEDLGEVQAGYEHVMRENGLELPYPKHSQV